MEKNKESEVGLRDVELVWMFDAPVELVWKAFTDPELEVQWARCITPVGSTEMEFLKHDLREGGKYLLRSVTPWSKVQFITGTYKKIVPLKELKYSSAFADERGNIISGREFGLGYDLPSLEWMVEVTLESLQGWTRLRLIQRDRVTTNGHSDFAATEIAKSLYNLAKIIERS